MGPGVRYKPSYEQFLERAHKDSSNCYVIVDGIPRSGTNFLRKVCTTMSSPDLVLQSARHFFNRYQYSDGYLHGRNVVHLFPLRDDVMDSLYSSMVLHEVFSRGLGLGSVSSILKATLGCLRFATTGDIKNIYFVRVSRPDYVAKAVEEVFRKHGVPHVPIDVNRMVSDLTKTDSVENFRSNRFPITNAQKDAEVLMAKETLSLEIFKQDISEIKRMHAQLLERSF